MATPRDDTRRSRATSEQSAMSEDEDVGLQKRAKEAFQRAQRLEPEVVQQVEQVGLKKLIELFCNLSED